MALILLVMSLSLLIQGSLCSLEQIDRGCMKWTTSKDKTGDVCCEICHPGNRLVKACGPDPSALCAPCPPNKFTVKPKDYSCSRCTQCLDAQILLKECTSTTDTQCDCKEGLTCGDKRCTFCVKKCGKGEEPTEKRSCRPCPDGFFNDQVHQKCKPWTTKCPTPDQTITMGDAVTDSKCDNITVTVRGSKQPDNTEESWPLVISVLTSVVLMALSITIIIIVTVIIHQKRRKAKKTITKNQIIRTPTDDPRTLIAIECSFHEAQQEQGSSSESLASKDSSELLIS